MNEAKQILRNLDLRDRINIFEDLIDGLRGESYYSENVISQLRACVEEARAELDHPLVTIDVQPPQVFVVDPQARILP